jgi:hypothetical protein
MAALNAFAQAVIKPNEFQATAITCIRDRVNVYGEWLLATSVQESTLKM